MKNLKFFGLVLVSFCLITKTYSQENFSIHFGPAFPVSDFASDDFDDDDSGAAATGLNIGLQYIYPLSENGIGIFGGIDLNYNGLQNDYEEDIEDYYDIGDADFKFSKYINIPVTAGLNYSYKADDKIGLFANAGLSLNFLKITDMEIEADGETASQEIESANSIGYKIGGGVSINQKILISIDYLGLGKHDLDGEFKGPGFSDDFDAELKVDIVTLTIGFKF